MKYLLTVLIMFSSMALGQQTEITDIGAQPSEEGKLHDDSIGFLSAQLADMHLKLNELLESVKASHRRLDSLETKQEYLLSVIPGIENRIHEITDIKDTYSWMYEQIQENKAANQDHYDTLIAYENSITQSIRLSDEHLLNEIEGTDGNEPTVVYDTVTFTGAAKGLNFTIPQSIVDGVNDLDAIKAAWDAANPTQVVNFSGQPGTYVPAAGDVVLADGRRTFQQIHDTISFD